MNKCKNCGGIKAFNPYKKACVCESCGSIFPISYNFNFPKKSTKENKELKVDEFAKTVMNIKCKSCGANLLLNKYQLQAKCPYCGDSSIKQTKTKNLMYIDSIIPFNFDKNEALTRLNNEIKSRNNVNTKVFKNITTDNIKGFYINCVVFDFETKSKYRGVFTYTKLVKNSDGDTEIVTYIKNVSGTYGKLFENLSVEVNSNFTQYDLHTIMPYKYAGAVDFKSDFINGYMLEYKDKILNEAMDTAKNMVKKLIEADLLQKYNCDKVQSLDLEVEYNEEKYNYCLVPIYTVRTTYKNKPYTTLINGQTGQVGHLPLSPWKILLKALIFVAIILFIVLAIIFFAK